MFLFLMGMVVGISMLVTISCIYVNKRDEDD